MKKIIALIALVLLLGIVFLLVLTYGSPQLSKSSYMWQKYSLEKELKAPQNYNGVWNDWNEDGILVASFIYHNGKKHGEQNEYHPDGYLFGKSNYQNGKQHGFQVSYMENGTVFMVREVAKGKLVNLTYDLLEDGSFIIMKAKPNGFTDAVYRPSRNIDIRDKHTKEINDFIKRFKDYEGVELELLDQNTTPK